MKKWIIMGFIVCSFIGLFVGGIVTDKVSSAVNGITKENYLDYEKPYKDPRYGYNKGESNYEYMEGEEEFYNEYIDHWNVDTVYTEPSEEIDNNITNTTIKNNNVSKETSVENKQNKETKPITNKQILSNWTKNKNYKSIDYIKLIDKYIKGKWYAYYIHCDGDIWIITIKNNKIDIACQLN